LENEHYRQDMGCILSIVIPSYNCGKNIQNALTSIYTQDIAKEFDFEVLIMDGLSSDNTSRIVEAFAEENLANNLHFFSEKDTGVYDAMNKSLTHASGSYIYFMGADDILLPNILSEISPLLRSQSTVYYGNAFFPKRGIIYDGKFNSYKIAIRNICHQAIFYPRKVFEVYRFNKKYNILADYALNLKLWVDKNYTFKYIPQTIAVFNDYSGISKTHVDINFENDKFELIKNNFKLSVVFYMRLRRFAYTLSKNLLKKR